MDRFVTIRDKDRSLAINAYDVSSVEKDGTELTVTGHDKKKTKFSFGTDAQAKKAHDNIVKQLNKD